MSDEFENKDNDEVRKVSDEISNRASADEPAGEPAPGDAGGYNNEGYNNDYNNNGYGNNGNNNGYNNNNYNNGYNNSYNNNGYNNNSYNNGYNNPYPGNGYNNDGSNENGGNGRKNKNRGPILGLVAAVLALALIIGGLYAAVEFSGAGKQAAKKSDQTVALTKDKTNETESADKGNTDKETAAVADKTDAKETDDAKLTTAVLNGDKVETTSKVQATALDVSAVVEEVMPSIVAVTNTTIYSSNGSSWGWYIGGTTSGQDYSSKGAGSGVIIAQTDEEVMVVTNAHVVVPEDYSKYGYTAESSEYEIKFCNDVSVKAYLKGYDESADVAVLTVKLSDIDKDTLNEIKIATVGDSTKLKVGNGAIVIGNALGYGQSVTVGCISALERDVRVDSGTKKLIQTDAAINPGNSGGGLFDTNGYLIGISEGKYSSTQVEGMCFAIPISSVESILTDIMNNNVKVREKVTDESKKAFLAIGTDKQYSQAYDGKGAFVYSVTEGGAADRAGIMAYDIITAINGVQIKNWSDLLEEMSYYEGGETVTITYYTFSERGRVREYVEKTVEVTLDFKADYVTDDEKQ